MCTQQLTYSHNDTRMNVNAKQNNETSAKTIPILIKFNTNNNSNNNHSPKSANGKRENRSLYVSLGGGDASKGSMVEKFAAAYLYLAHPGD